MSDLGNRLDTLAGEATRGVTLLPIDLAAHVRRRRSRRVRVAATLAACTAVAAVAIVTWPTSGHEVKVTTASPTTAQTTHKVSPLTTAVPASGSPNLNLTVSAGCPASVTTYGDVTNTYPGPPLLPDHPVAGLVCWYQTDYGLPSSNTSKLASHTHLDRGQAQQLATAIRGLDLGRPVGASSCPSSNIVTFALIGFSYPSRRDVSLKYSATGCQTLDNGRISAFEIGNPSFYNTFMGVIDTVSPPPS